MKNSKRKHTLVLSKKKFNNGRKNTVVYYTFETATIIGTESALINVLAVVNYLPTVQRSSSMYCIRADLYVLHSETVCNFCASL